MSMFDIWQKIEEKSTVAIPTQVSALSALGWVEIGEKYPELMPEEFRGYDIYSDPQLILTSPFVETEKDGCLSFAFKATDPQTGKEIDVSIDEKELMLSLRKADFYADEWDSSYGGVLVCSCGYAGCAGVWSQTCHVSSKMVHWSVRHYDDKLELFFERDAYERGAFEMLSILAENPDKYSMIYDSYYERNHEAFAEEVFGLLHD